MITARTDAGRRLQVAALRQDLTGLRRGLADRAQPDPEAWTRLADAVTRLQLEGADGTESSASATARS
jgi:hypothetical protein